MDQDRTPNWEKWRHVPNVKLWEAVALSLNIEPALVKHSKHGWMSDSHLFDESKLFKDRIFVAKRNLSTDGPLKPTAIATGHPEGCEFSLAEFAGWACSISWEIPPELGEKIELATDAQQNKPDSIEKPLQTRERNNLLMIIAALAEIADIDISAPHKAAYVIAMHTELMGRSISQKTIANKLKEIPEALEAGKEPKW